jgi:thiol-disulfide isomerase/thioredoxin
MDIGATIIKNKKKYIIPKCILVTLVLLLLTGQVRHDYLVYDVGVSCFSFFLVNYLFVRKYKADAQKITITFVASIVALYLLASITEGFYLLAVPNFSSMILGCIAAYFFSKGGVAIKAIAIVVQLLFTSLYVFKLGQLWLNYVNYHTFTGRVDVRENTEQQKWTSYIINKEAIDTANDKIVVLDFYITSCGLCVRGFPILQRLYEKYKDNGRISVNSVNVHISRDKEGQAVEMVRKRKFTFPVLLADDSLGKAMGIIGYPTVFVLQHDSILFRGSLEGAEKVVDERLK